MGKKAIYLGLNAKYIHTTYALRLIRGYVQSETNEHECVLLECTINQKPFDILSAIMKHNPDMVLFSLYIWNIDFAIRLICDLKKIAPNITIIAGGPEIAYNAKSYMEKYNEIDYVAISEGEKVVLSLLNDEIPPGIMYRKNGIIMDSGRPEVIVDLSEIPFPYTKEELINMPNQVIYYESSRGCPFSCAYCLSSRDTSVRKYDLERVKADLDIFLEAKVPLVKFIDRTFNLDKEHYQNIWKYIIENHNGHTLFHFEITAYLLDDEDIQLLSKCGPGIFQFEIGVQSTYVQTLKCVKRPVQLEKQKSMILQIPDTIHTHLDLIAGLPHEGLEQFAHSFNYTIECMPDMLQLGFLKVLSGTQMEKIATTESIIYSKYPPYEVLSTKELSFNDISFLKDLEKTVDWYYNSHRISSCYKYITKLCKPFDFFSELTNYFRIKGVFEYPQTNENYYYYVLNFFRTREDGDILEELLRFDFYNSGNIKKIPTWFTRRYDKARHTEMLEGMMPEFSQSKRTGFINSNYDEFTINPITGENEYCAVLFIYDETKITKVRVIGVDRNL